jgi:hypothetical protein
MFVLRVFFHATKVGIIIIPRNILAKSHYRPNMKPKKNKIFHHLSRPIFGCHTQNQIQKSMAFFLSVFFRFLTFGD